MTSSEHPMVAHVQQVLHEQGVAGEVRHLAAAGHPHTVFPTTFDELLQITGAPPPRSTPTERRRWTTALDDGAARPVG